MAPRLTRNLNIIAPVLALLLALGACAGGTTTTTGLAANQTLTFPLLADYGSLDPGVSHLEADQETQQNMFDGLVKYDDNLNISPDIAQAIPTVSSDGLTYTFKLRQDVTFSNGDKLTSKDVLYSWNRAAALQGAYATNFSAIEGYDTVSQNTKSGGVLESLLEKRDPSVWMRGVTAPDAYTVVVRLAKPAGWFLAAISLAGATGEIVDANAVRRNPDTWWRNPATAIGTGPFRMTAYTPKHSVDFQAVSNWWGRPKPTLQKVHIDESVTDGSSAIIKYEQGGYDLVGYGGYSLPVADVLRIEHTGYEQSQLLLHAKVRTAWVSFNMWDDASRPAKGPFAINARDAGDAKKLRQAFDLAVNKTNLVATVCQNILCIPATGGLIPPSLIGYLGADQDPLARFDPTQAKQLLVQADPTGSETKGLTYTFDSENPLNTPVAEFLRSQWHDNLGVDVKIQAVSHSQFIQAALKGSYVLSGDGWHAGYDHPHDWYANLWGKIAGCPDSSCTSGYDTAAYDLTLAKADAEPIAQEAADYKKLQQMLIDEVAYIPLYYSTGSFLIKPYIKGAGTNSLFDHYWNEIQIESH